MGSWGRFTPDIQRLACDSLLQHLHAPCHNLGLFRVHVLQICLCLDFQISHHRPLPLSTGLNEPEFRHSFFFIKIFHFLLLFGCIEIRVQMKSFFIPEKSCGIYLTEYFFKCPNQDIGPIARVI